MPRPSVTARCKKCGASATVKQYSSKGANGRRYFYEKYTHRNGVAHYVRVERGEKVVDSGDIFEQIIKRKMARRNYRFKEIKSIFEAMLGTNVSNSYLSRNLERAIRYNLLEKVGGETTFYRKKDLRNFVNDLRISDLSLTFSIVQGEVSINSFLSMVNNSNGLVPSVPITLPYDNFDFSKGTEVQVWDHDGRIDRANLIRTYTHPGQTGVLINLNRPLRPSEKGFLFISGKFPLSDDSLKLALHVNVDELRVNFNSDYGYEVKITKRLLDGIKENSPENVRSGLLSRGSSYTQAEFKDVRKGETIVISW